MWGHLVKTLTRWISEFRSSSRKTFPTRLVRLHLVERHLERQIPGGRVDARVFAEGDMVIVELRRAYQYAARVFASTVPVSQITSWAKAEMA